MKALLFLVRRMILNWIKELKKHPGAAIFYILLLAFISFSVINDKNSFFSFSYSFFPAPR